MRTSAVSGVETTGAAGRQAETTSSAHRTIGASRSIAVREVRPTSRCSPKPQSAELLSTVGSRSAATEIPRPCPRSAALLERLVGERQVIPAVPLQVPPLALVQHLAHPAPVQGHPVTCLCAVGKTATIHLAHHALAARRIQNQLAIAQ